MRRGSTVAFGLILVLLFAAGRFARADEVPDPCKLLSATEAHDVLGTTSPFVMQPNSWAPMASEHVEKTRFGNLESVISLSGKKRNNCLRCLARAGDLWLDIRVTALKQAQAEEAKHRRDLELLEPKLGYKLQLATYSDTACEEVLTPAADMLGREARFGDLRVTRIRCYVDRNGWRIAITAHPWQPEKDLPFTTNKLHTLVELAAQRLGSTPPTPAQNVATTDGGLSLETLIP